MHDLKQRIKNNGHHDCVQQWAELKNIIDRVENACNGHAAQLSSGLAGVKQNIDDRNVWKSNIENKCGATT